MAESPPINSQEHETVLVIDDEEIIRQLLKDYFTLEGFPVLTAASGEEGIEVFEKHHPSIVLTDVRMPGMNGMQVLRALRRENHDIKVVLMTGYGDDRVAVDALRAGASSFVKKPLSLEEILFIVRAHERMLQAEKRQRLPKGALVDERKTLCLANNQAHVHPAVYHVTQGLRGALPHQEIESVALALTEALINAMEHGNLGIGYHQKSEALRESRYQQLIEERIADAKFSKRNTKLEVHITPTEARFTVTDEGEGFDWSNRPDPTNPENLLREHGRGLSMICLFMDNVFFNEKGNQITMIKKIDPNRDEDTKY